MLQYQPSSHEPEPNSPSIHTYSISIQIPPQHPVESLAWCCLSPAPSTPPLQLLTSLTSGHGSYDNSWWAMLGSWQLIVQESHGLLRAQRSIAQHSSTSPCVHNCSHLQHTPVISSDTWSLHMVLHIHRNAQFAQSPGDRGRSA